MHKRLLLKIAFYLLVGFASYFSGKLFLSSITKLDISDFHVYYYVPKMVFDAKSPTHPYVSYIPIYPYFFPPASIPLLYPLSLVPFYLSKIIWTLLNFVFLFSSIYLILKSLNKFNWVYFFILTLIATNFFPIIFTIEDGQFNIVLLFIFSLGLYFFEKNKYFFLTAIFIALGIVSKISPGILLFYALIKKKFKLIIISGFSVVLFFALSEYFVEYKINLYYFRNAISKVSEQSSGFGSREQSSLALIKRINSTLPEKLPKIYQSIILYTFVFLLISLFVYFEFRKPQSKLNNLINISLLSFIAVTGTGLTWFHQYSILFLPLTIMIFIAVFYLKKHRAYFIFSYLIVLILWGIDFFDTFYNQSYLELYMFWAGWVFLINTFYIKANQKYVSNSELISIDFEQYRLTKYLFIVIFLSFFYGVDLLNINENLKIARDESRVKEINFMSKVLIKSDVRYKIGEANSFSNSIRADRGYILLENNEYQKIQHQMRVLYLDTINNEIYKYKFKSEDGVGFELSAKLESKEYVNRYGEIYSVKYLGK